MEGTFKGMKEKIKDSKKIRDNANKDNNDIYENTKQIRDNFNTKLEDRIKKGLVNELDIASKKFVEFENEKEMYMKKKRKNLNH